MRFRRAVTLSIASIIAGSDARRSRTCVSSLQRPASLHSVKRSPYKLLGFTVSPTSTSAHASRSAGILHARCDRRRTCRSRGRARKIVGALRPWRISAAPFAFAVIEFGAGSLDGCDIERGDRLYVEVTATAS
jgi:hypothetical protein